jgi:hypothetical protein
MPDPCVEELAFRRFTRDGSASSAHELRVRELLNG